MGIGMGIAAGRSATAARPKPRLTSARPIRSTSSVVPPHSVGIFAAPGAPCGSCLLGSQKILLSVAFELIEAASHAARGPERQKAAWSPRAQVRRGLAHTGQELHVGGRAGEQPNDPRVAVVRQWIHPHESTRMHERLFRTVVQLVNESAKRAEGRTLGETALLVAITSRRIQTVQELTTGQTERCFKASGDVFGMSASRSRTVVRSTMALQGSKPIWDRSVLRRTVFSASSRGVILAKLQRSSPRGSSGTPIRDRTAIRADGLCRL